ncbi:phage tail assembly protein [Nitrosospira sp. NpAV]|uniref:phage tail assembly protein n=1 Tax=Nitrosospira sp. NpAV TaxID=58133 RepID=UPI0005A067B0|nr:phage tail assembly protein [Nitrosospira sp. NpAV]KIO49594.1 hypothetical protein SQ11_05565 [Nitrosospira sp. NpAV]
MQTTTGKFKHGLKIGDEVYTDFEMREITVQDMTDAEVAATRQGGGMHTPMTFNAHAMVRQLQSVSNQNGGIYQGPFTFAMLQRLKPADYWELRGAQQELDELGEAE